jgi:hypothetical protein
LSAFIASVINTLLHIRVALQQRAVVGSKKMKKKWVLNY